MPVFHDGQFLFQCASFELNRFEPCPELERWYVRIFRKIEETFFLDDN